MTELSPDQLIANLDRYTKPKIRYGQAHTGSSKNPEAIGHAYARLIGFLRLTSSNRVDCNGPESQFSMMKTVFGSRSVHWRHVHYILGLFRVLAVTVFNMLSQLRYHGIVTFEKRFSRGTQRIMSLLEVIFTLACACGAYKFSQSLMALLFGTLDLSLVSSAGFTVYGLLHVLMLGLAFSAGLIISNAFFIRLVHVIYPLGTGRGRARLDRHYVNLVERINQGQLEPAHHEMSYANSDNKLIGRDVVDCISDVIERFELRSETVSGFSDTISLLNKTNPKASRIWLLDNMINAVRDFKNGVKLTLSYPNVNHVVRDQRSAMHVKLVGLVRYMKNRQTTKYSYDQIESLYCDVATFLTDKRLTRFPYDLNDVTKCALGLAFETLIQLDLIANNKGNAHCGDSHACGGCCHDEGFSTATISKAPVQSGTFSRNKSNLDSVIVHSPGLIQSTCITSHCVQDQYNSASHVAGRSSHPETLPSTRACGPSADGDVLRRGLSERSIRHHVYFETDIQPSFLRPPFALCQDCGSPNSICAVNS